MSLFNWSDPLYLLSVPVKETTETNWRGAIEKMIEEMEEDPYAYESEIAALNKLRQDMRGAEPNTTGKVVCFQYYQQLDFLSLRFNLEKGLDAKFTWYDAFDRRSGTTQSSLAFEKANLLFNLGALNSQIATRQLLSDESGHKVATQAFQTAASIFVWISENFLHPPLVDIQQPTLEFLGAVMLAQGQEVVLHKAASEAKSPSVLAKLASGTAALYHDAASKAVEVWEIEKEWLPCIQAKARLWQAASELWRAEAAVAEEAHGEALARLGTAMDLFSNFPFKPLRAIAEKCAAIAKERKVIAEKENALIYHQTTPFVVSPIEPLVLAKTAGFHEATMELKAVAPGDLLHRLVPLRVHEDLSRYSEEKAKLLRFEAAKVQEADAEFAEALLKCPPLNQVPAEVQELRRRAKNLSLPDLEPRISSIEGRLKRIDTLLDEEIVKYEESRQRFGGDWTMPPSHTVNGKLFDRLAVLLKGVSLIERKFSFREKILLLRGDDLEKVFKVSLVDDNFDELVGDVQRIMSELERVASERSVLFSKLKGQLQEDEVSAQTLLVRKKSHEDIFSKELAKFDGPCTALEENIKKSHDLVTKLKSVWSDAFKQLANRADPKLIEEFVLAVSQAESLQEKSRKLEEISIITAQLEKDTHHYLEERSRLHSDLLKQMNVKEGERRKSLLQDRLEKLKVSNSQPNMVEPREPSLLD